MAVPAFAAQNSGKVVLTQAVTVGTTQIPAAEYKVTWNDTGSVTLAHDKSVFTLPAKVTAQKNSVTSIRTDSKNGTTVLTGIELPKVSVEFTSAPTSGQ
jgi:hypothetical protein